jgi:hypothetical protein
MAAGKGNKKNPAAKSPAAVSFFTQAAMKAGLTTHAGKSAVQGVYHPGVTLRAGFAHTQSIDLDAHYAAAEPHATRWDYGLGLRTTAGVEMAVWLEPHPASSSSEVNKMISKLTWLKAKLDSASFSDLRSLRDVAARHGKFPYRWLVTQSGGISIAPNSKEAKRLALAGLDQPRRQVQLP